MTTVVLSHQQRAALGLDGQQEAGEGADHAGRGEGQHGVDHRMRHQYLTRHNEIQHSRCLYSHGMFTPHPLLLRYSSKHTFSKQLVIAPSKYSKRFSSKLYSYKHKYKNNSEQFVI